MELLPGPFPFLEVREQSQEPVDTIEACEGQGQVQGRFPYEARQQEFAQVVVEHAAHYAGYVIGEGRGSE